MQGKKYNDAKKEIRSVLLTYQKPVNLNTFLKTYKDLLGERLPTRSLGFNSDIDLLKSMPDVVHVITNEIGTVLLSGIADQTSLHIQRLVSKQRMPKVNNSKPKKNLPKQLNMPLGIRESHPYVPGAIRAEILQVMTMFPDGVSLPTFVLAYHKKFNKYLSLEKGLETLEYIVNSIEELELRNVRNEKKIFCKTAQAKNGTSKVYEPFRKIPTSQDKKENNCEVIQQNNISSVIHKSGISEQMQKNFHLVLQKCPEGILAVHFPPLYENVIRESFDLHQLGYNSILELADALPAIFKRILDPRNDKNWILLPANSTLTFDYRSEKVRQPTENSSLSNHKMPFPLKLREGIPADVTPPLLQYMKPKMPENINLSEYLPVFVSAIISPSLFWFQLKTDDVAESFDELEKNLGSFYSSYNSERYKMNDADLVVGAVCVVQCPDDKQWYRAVIKSIPNVDFVNVLFVDYGSRDNVPRTNLRYLRNKYCGYPAAAFRAYLDRLKPPKNASTWNIEAQRRFIQLCESASLMAYLKPDINDTFSTDLCDTSGETDVHLNDTLIREGYAELCLGSQFRDCDFSSECKYSVISNGVDHGVENDISPKSSSSISPSYDYKEQKDHSVKQIDKDNSVTEKNKFPANRKLSFSPEERSNNTQLEVSQKAGKQCSKRYVKRLKLCENSMVHIINVEDKPYVSEGDLCNLFWSDKGANYLAERLKYKEVTVPCVEIFKENNPDLFNQCKWYKIPEFRRFESDTSMLVLYPLTWAFNILNIFGHPSICLRLAIQNEMKNFDPRNPIWKEFCYEESLNLEEMEKEIEEKLGRLCLYDLKAKYEALKIKRLKLIKGNNTFAGEEIKRVEHLQFIIEKRIKYIQDICSQYSSCS